MMNFSEVKTILESVSELVKKARTLDLQEKIVDLREYIISLKDDNISLKEENQNLKLERENKEIFALKNGLYWKEDDNVPFCQRCLDGSNKRIHLQIYGDGWKCFDCDKYYDPPHLAGRVQIFHSGFDDRNSAL
jgi:regulator of replication initiation timing